MAIWNFFFSFEGRIGRLAYLCGQAMLWIANGLNFLILAKLSGPSVLHILLLPFSIAVVWASLAIGIKRLHDLDKPGWLIVVPMVQVLSLILLAVLVGAQYGLQQQASVPVGSAILAPFALVVLALSGWAFWITIQLYFFKGSNGINSHGAPMRASDLFGGEDAMPGFAPEPAFAGAPPATAASAPVDRLPMRPKRAPGAGAAPQGPRGFGRRV